MSSPFFVANFANPNWVFVPARCAGICFDDAQKIHNLQLLANENARKHNSLLLLAQN